MKSDNRNMHFQLLEESEDENKSSCEKCLLPISVFIPLSSLVTILTTLVILHKQNMDMNGRTRHQICPQTLLIARLVVSFNNERDLTVQIVTDKSKDMPQLLVNKREAIYQGTDNLLSGLASFWPNFFQKRNSTMFKSAHLFIAILSTHRASVKPGSYFWDEIRFYADIIEDFLLWLNQETQSCSGSDAGRSFYHGNHETTLFGVLNSFLLLMTSLAYLGAEQSMCLAFHAVACFSHKETFNYANFTFGAETIFRSYQHSLLTLNQPRKYQWPPDYKSIFPELSYCRQEILAEMDNTGEPINPSVCNHSRRNESYIIEVTHMATIEMHFFSTLLETILNKQRNHETFWFNLSIFLLVGALAYGIIVSLVWCFYLRCQKSVLKRKQKRSSGISLRKFPRDDSNCPPSLLQRSRLNNSETFPHRCLKHEKQMVTFGALKVASV